MKSKSFFKKLIFITFIFLIIAFMAAPVLAQIPENPSTSGHEPVYNNFGHIFSVISLITFICFIFFTIKSASLSKRITESQNNKDKKQTPELDLNKSLKLYQRLKLFSYIIWLILAVIIFRDYYSGNSGPISIMTSINIYITMLILIIIWLLKSIIRKNFTKTTIICILLSVLVFIITPIEMHKSVLSMIPYSLVHIFEYALGYIEIFFLWQ